jgi:hypothetical protein
MDCTPVTIQEFAQAMTWASRTKHLIKIETNQDGLRMAWSADSLHRLFAVAGTGMTIRLI